MSVTRRKTSGVIDPISAGSISARIDSREVAGGHDQQPIVHIAQLKDIPRPLVQPEVPPSRLLQSAGVPFPKLERHAP
jgi:hypothetical protein